MSGDGWGGGKIRYWGTKGVGGKDEIGWGAMRDGEAVGWGVAERWLEMDSGED